MERYRKCLVVILVALLLVLAGAILARHEPRHVDRLFDVLEALLLRVLVPLGS